MLVDPLDPVEVEPLEPLDPPDALVDGAVVALGELLGLVAVDEVPGVAVGEEFVALVLGDDGSDALTEDVFDSCWKKAMPSAAVPPNATVVIVPSTAPAARAPRMRTFMETPPCKT